MSRRPRFLATQSDERLAQLASTGHEHAFAVIVERYHTELLLQARRFRWEGDAEDLLQQTLLDAFAAFRSGAEVRHLRGWLHQILRHNASRARNRQGSEARVESDIACTESVEEVVQRRLLARQVLTELAALPEGQRNAILATAVQGHKRAAVAGSMGVSEGAVRQLMHRARVTLRRGVAAVTPYPLARWIETVNGPAVSDRTPDISTGLGAASAGGIAVKLGAIASAGVLAAGVVASDLNGHHVSRTSVSHRPSEPRSPAGRTPRVARTAGLAGGPVLVDRRPAVEPVLRVTRPAPASRRQGGGGGSGGGGGHSESSRGGPGPAESSGSRSPDGSGSSDGSSDSHGSGSPGGPGPSSGSGGPSSPDHSSDSGSPGGPGPSSDSGSPDGSSRRSGSGSSGGSKGSDGSSDSHGG